MDIEKISNLIKTKRKEKKLTQQQLAQKLNVTEKAISRWETGRGTPDISLLIPLSKELGVSTNELLNGEENNIEEIINYIDNNKKNKNKTPLIISVIIYSITLILYLSYLKVEYGMTKLQISYKGELVFNTIFIILIAISNKILGTYYVDKIEEKNKIKKTTYIIALIIYTIMIFNLTLFTRRIGEIKYNLIPLKTISDYIINIKKYNLREININIFGNIFIFMPVQYLIIKIFELKKTKIIILIDLIILLSIELSQLITHTGIFDIDDIILNLSGMLITLIIMKLNHQFVLKNKNS